MSNVGAMAGPHQPDLFEAGLAPVDLDPDWSKRPLDERFDEFHRRNPHVAAQLVRMTQALIDRGHRRMSVKTFFEVLRWQWAMTTDDPAASWKLNNSYAAYYARLLVREHPEFEGVFEMRRSVADDD